MQAEEGKRRWCLPILLARLAGWLAGWLAGAARGIWAFLRFTPRPPRQRRWWG